MTSAQARPKLQIGLDGNLGAYDTALKSVTDYMPGKDSLKPYMKHREKEPVAMHLINGKLGGSGKTAENLAWGTSNFNAKHRDEWETPLRTIAADISYDRCFMYMEVSATYCENSDKKDPRYYLLQSLTCKHKVENAKHRIIDKWKTLTLEDGEPVETESQQAFELDSQEYDED
jgi:hypothetical protein